MTAPVPAANTTNQYSKSQSNKHTDTDTTTKERSPSTPGIYLVNSGIRPSAKSILSVDLFDKWYNEVHIPDIFVTSPRIINTAYRFSSISAPSSSTEGELPYLAIYPLESTSLLTHEKSPLWKVPLTSEVLPNESKHIFDLVDFQMGIWETVVQLRFEGRDFSAKLEPPPSNDGPAGKYIALVGISQDEVSEAQARSGSDLENLLQESVLFEVEGENEKRERKRPEKKPKRSTLVGWVDYSPPGAPAAERQGVKLSGYRRFLGIHEYDELPTGNLFGSNGAEVYLFSALTSFGDVRKAW
ncbi:hypothetical protein V8F20_011458 [Naviculisporaceae sp. PSN 640]